MIKKVKYVQLNVNAVLYTVLKNIHTLCYVIKDHYKHYRKYKRNKTIIKLLEIGAESLPNNIINNNNNNVA